MNVEISPKGTETVLCDADKNQKLTSGSLLKYHKFSRSKANHNHGNLKIGDIQDALELSIAASEALVISEMFSSELISDALPGPAAVLEVALRVKQARNISNLDMLGMVSDLSANALDETDQLSDLDEAILASAYEDVGLSFPQPVKTPDRSLSIRNPCHGCCTSYKGRQLASHMVSPYSAKPNPGCLKMTENEQDENVTPQVPHRDGSMIKKRDSSSVKFYVDTKKRIRNYFIGESSFISESLDTMNEHAAEQQVDGSEIVGSSNTPILFGCGGSESPRTISDKAFPSRDPFLSSNQELDDPLCSIVPCSLTADSASFLEYDENHSSEHSRELMHPVRSPILSDAGKSKALNLNAALPSESLIISSTHDFVKVENEGFGMTSRRHLKSLKLFSTLTPCEQKANTRLHNKDTLLDRVHMLFRVHEDTNCEQLMKQETVWDSFNLKANILDKNGSSKFHTSKSKFDVTEKPTTVGETWDEGFDLSVGTHKERSSPLFLNTNTHCRVMGYKSFSYSDYEDKNSDRRAATRKRKHKLNYSEEGIACRDDAAPSGLNAIRPNNRKLPKRRVCFLEAKDDNDSPEVVGTPQRQFGSHGGICKREKPLNLIQWDENRTRYSTMDGMIFQRFEFLLTGYSSRKENELELMIRKFGGSVLSNIPSYWTKYGMKYSSWKLPIILSPKKVQSTKFLCGCAVNALTLNANWLFYSIEAGSVLQPSKYMTRFIQSPERNFSKIGELLYHDRLAFIFDKVGIMPYGKAGFVIKFSKVIKCGHGRVYKSLHKLVEGLRIGKLLMAAVVVENESSMPRHLKHCALENNLLIESASWIIDSLFSGKMLPTKKDCFAPLH